MESNVLNASTLNDSSMPHDILALSATHLAVALATVHRFPSLQSVAEFAPKQMRKPERQPLKENGQPRKLPDYLLLSQPLIRANYGVGRGCGLGRGLGVALGVWRRRSEVE